MIRVSVLGATGYAGAELVRLLAGHESVKIVHLGSKNYAGQNIDDLFRSLRALALPVLEAADESVADDSDVIFTSLPHGTSEEVIAALYQTGKRIIDLSGDFRYDDAAVYEKWYGLTHSCPDILAKSVYGLPELHREMIRPAQLIGNPGCYTTCSILALAPLAAHKLIDADTIIIDAKSGASGAGRGLTLQTHFNELDESVKAYGVGTHRHTSEIEQELSKLYGHAIQLSFTPHLLPIKRGILATSYAKLSGNITEEAVFDLFKEFYAGEPFVDVYAPGSLPEIKDTVGSNKFAVGFVIDRRLSRIITVSSLDNLIKGAAGQAIQNMNIMFGLDERAGLTTLPLYI